MTDDELIRTYYDHFNARRMADATAMLADDAHMEHRGVGLVGDGSDNYARFAERWLTAFPDLQLRIERIEGFDISCRSETVASPRRRSASTPTI